MKFQTCSQLRKRFPTGAILQLRMITEKDSTVEAEGPAASSDAGHFRSSAGRRRDHRKHHRSVEGRLEMSRGESMAECGCEARRKLGIARGVPVVERPTPIREEATKPITFDYNCKQCPGDGVIRGTRPGIDWPRPCPCRAQKTFTRYQLARLLGERPETLLRLYNLRTGSEVARRVLTKIANTFPEALR